MDLFNALSYLNKLSLFAFFVTAVVLIYQVVVIKKNSGKKETKVTVPDFDEKMAIPVKNFTVINEEKIIHKASPMPKTLLYSIIGVTLTCLIVVVYLINRQNQTVSTSNTISEIPKISPTTVVRRVISPTASVIRNISPTSAGIPTLIVTVVPTSTPAVPTRVPTTTSNEVAIAYISPTGTVTTTVTTGTAAPTNKEKSLPLTGSVENTIVIGVVSGFLIMLAFVF